MQEDSGRVRYFFIDELRGAAVLCMVVYHAFFTAGLIFNWRAGQDLLYFFMPAEPVFAALFIFISGFCTRFSRNVARRGAGLMLIAAAITAVTLLLDKYVPETAIYFGVVHLIAFSMLIFAALRRVLRKIPKVLGLAVAAALFFLTYGVKDGYLGIGKAVLYTLPARLYTGGVWSVFGFQDAGFGSSDYFPVLPWVFVFFAGAFAGMLGENRPLPKTLEKKRVPALAFLGRYSLWIYIAHQPVIFAICLAISALT